MNSPLRGGLQPPSVRLRGRKPNSSVRAGGRPAEGHGAANSFARPVASAPALTALVIALACLTTVQSTYNSSPHVYTTDVGEIQNALPRWGTIHFTGYPVYSALGSLFVTLLRLVAVPPALATSLYSLVWAALAGACVAALAVRLGAGRWAAVVGACAYGLSTSAWMNGSIAEIHSATLFFTALCLWLAVRYDESGDRVDLLWLALAFVQGVLHMRAILFLAPALAILVAPRWRAILRAWRPLAAIAVLSPLVYLYLPLRERMGATWTFGQTSTWRGFWAMVLDTKADRIVHPPAGAAEWWQRARTVAGLFGDDVWLPLLILGLVGVFALVASARGGTADVDAAPGDVGGPASESDIARQSGKRSRYTSRRSRWNRERSPYSWDDSPANLRRTPVDAWRLALGLTAAWVPYAALCLVIWEGKVSDALLAVKLPVPLIAGVGLALALTWLAERGGDAVGRGVLLVAALAVAALAVRSYRTIAPIVHDRSLAPLVADADRLSIGMTNAGSSGPLASTTAASATTAAATANRPVTLMALWGHSFWALSYAQAFQHRIGGLTLVDHNADVGAIARGGMLLTPSDTVTVLDVDWWRDRVGDADGHVHPEMIAPGIVWLRSTPRSADDVAIAGVDDGLGWATRLSNGFPNAWPPSPSAKPFAVNDALAIAAADVRCPADDPTLLVVTLDWLATRPPERDESIAVHVLVAPDERVLAQADRAVPVDGWRPTSSWAVGERVRDMIAVRAEAADEATVRVMEYEDVARTTVQVTAYHGDGQGGFVNGAWLRLAVPATCSVGRRGD